MYLAKTINDILESKKNKLIGRSSYFYICDVLTRAFRSVEPFKFKFETYREYDKEDYSVSGIFDAEKNVRYIVLNFPTSCKTFNLKPSKWKDFKFAISQVCQHEAIHQCQWLARGGDYVLNQEKLDFRNIEGTIEEEQLYLADPDEIDAYGHDIAMEIKYFYPKKDPIVVLSNINRHRKLWSYVYYKKTFKNEDWSQIRNRLIKKTHRWLPYVTV